MSYFLKISYSFSGGLNRPLPVIPVMQWSGTGTSQHLFQDFSYSFCLSTKICHPTSDSVTGGTVMFSWLLSASELKLTVKNIFLNPPPKKKNNSCCCKINPPSLKTILHQFQKDFCLNHTHFKPKANQTEVPTGEKKCSCKEHGAKTAICNERFMSFFLQPWEQIQFSIHEEEEQTFNLFQHQLFCFLLQVNYTCRSLLVWIKGLSSVSLPLVWLVLFIPSFDLDFCFYLLPSPISQFPWS